MGGGVIAKVLPTYTITFKDIDDSIISTKVYKQGETVTPPSDPSREGYDFTGWSPSVSPTAVADATYIAQYEEAKYVDLGLPSGLKWAKCNVGATSETEYGLLFQWGATEGHDYDTDANDYPTWSTAPFNNGSSSYDSAYFASVSGDVCPNGVLAAQYDAASVATSGAAHMPTQDDFKELTANTKSLWVVDFNGSGVNGRKFTSKKDETKYIFIPASGKAYGGEVRYRKLNCYVYSSSLNTDNPNFTLGLALGGGDMGMGDHYRYNGYSVRGVVSKQA